MKRTTAAMGAALLCLSLCLGCGWFDDDDDGNQGQGEGNGATGSTATSAAPPASNVQGVPSNIPDLIEEVRTSIVSILAGQGEGSGVVWSADGNIVTNEHVVQGATALQVVLSTGERLPASVVATDPLTDLAVVKVERDDLDPATFSDEVPRVGTPVVAIGNPLGFENSVSLGIVSGVNRAIPSGGATPALVDLLQTDAAISPGNSGGALVDTNAEVVGVNVAFIPPTQEAVALGFAIPSVTVINVVEQLLETGTVEHSFLGIEPRPLTPQIAAQLGLNVSEGVFVFALEDGGPAQEAGIEPGDVIVGFNGDEIASLEDLYTALRETAPGESVEVRLVRGGDEQTVSVTLADRPAAP
jgi:serine protease DegQ